MNNKFRDISGEINEASKEIKKNAPNSDDLNYHGISEDFISGEVDKAFIENIFSEFDNVGKNFITLFSVTGDVRKSFEKVIGKFVGRDIESQDFDKIFGTIGKKNILKKIITKDFRKNSDLSEDEFFEKIISLENNFKDKKDLSFDKKYEISQEEKDDLKKIFDQLKNSKEFEKFIFENFTSDKKFLEEFSKILGALKKVSGNEDLKFNLSGSLKDWNLKKGLEFYKNFDLQKILIFGSVFTGTVTGDIYALSRFLSPEGSIASGFLNTFSKLQENYSEGLIDGIDIAAGSSFGITDLTFKIFFVKWIYKNISSTKKLGIKDYTEGASLFLGMSAAIFAAGGLQGISAGYTANSANEKIKVIDGSSRGIESKKSYKISDNGTEILVQKEGFKKDIDNVLDGFNQVGNILPSMFGVYYDFIFTGGGIDKNHDYEKVLLNLQSDLESGKLDTVGWLGTMNNNIENIEKFADLKGLYRSTFENILLEIRGVSSTGKPYFGPAAREKTAFLLRKAGFDKGDNIKEQLVNFVKYIYEDFPIEMDTHLKEVEDGFSKNASFKDLGKIELISDVNLKDIENAFLEKNIGKINQYKKRIKDLILNIDPKNINSLKIPELNKIIKEYGQFSSGELADDSVKYDNARNDLSKYMQEELRKISLKHKKVENYTRAEVDPKKLILGDKIEPLPERYAEFDDFTADLKEGVKEFKITGKLKPSIISFINYFTGFVLGNFIDIALILFLIRRSRNKGKREISNGKILDQKELLNYRDEKFLEVKKEIFDSIGEIGKIFKEMGDKSKNCGLNKEQLENFSEFIENFGVFKKGNNLIGYSKELNNASSEYDFCGGKMYNLTGIGQLERFNYKSFGSEDVIFVSSFVAGVRDKIGIKRDEDGGFMIVLKPDSSIKMDSVIDLGGNDFKSAISEGGVIGNSNFEGITGNHMVGLLISKDGFVLMPYNYDKKEEGSKFNSLTELDLLKYIKN